MARLGALLAIFSGLLASASAAAAAVPTPGVADITSALGGGLIEDINAFITLQSLVTNQISLNFDVKNPLLLFELTIDSISATASLNGTNYFTFSRSFASPGLVVPPLGTANSGTINNVVLTQTLLLTLPIVQFGVLDVVTDATVRALSINGIAGIPLTLNNIQQSTVPTNYSVQLF